MIRVNIGCGQTPTPGWHNYDNSMSLKIANYPLFFTYILNKFGMLSEGQKQFINFFRHNKIKWADAAKYIPLPDKSVDVLYSSHLIEHLDQDEVRFFLTEARRILIKDGIIRIVAPDLRKMIDEYMVDGDSDAFIKKTGLAHGRPKSILKKLSYFIIGESRHRWMYDGASLIRLFSSMGFRDACILPPGTTMIPDPGELNLWEKAEESVFLEAYNLK